MKTIYRLLLLALFTFYGCVETETKDIASNTINPEAYWGDSPWPDIRKERINTLLPNALKNANVDAWLTICRENNNDPMADHIGGENAGGTAVFLFYNDA